MNIVTTLPQNRAFYVYLLKLTNTSTGQVYFKLGKADDIIKRYKDWKKDLMKVLSFYDKIISSNGWKIELVWSKHCWYVDGVYKYYMTSNSNKLTGNDSDDIFRKILVEYFNVTVYKINIYDTFLTDEGVNFNTNDVQEIKGILENAYTKWIEIIKERNVSSCDYFVRLDLHEIKKNQKIKKEFSEIRYDYQKKAVNWIYNKLSSGNNEDFLAIIPCGAGKTSISMDACVRISVENEYKPILLLAGLKSVFNAFDGDSEKFTYSGKEVLCYDLTHFHKSIGETNAKLGKVTLVYTTCQAGIKRGDDENDVDMDSKLSERLFRVLDDGVQFSTIITDEAHKIVFGGKMMTLYPEIRKYHINPLNIIHMSGTGFNSTRKMDFHNKIYNISEKEIRKAQGIKAVNRHMIVCRNMGFIPFFETHIAEGWNQILNGNIKVDMFKDVDSINCISTIKSGIEKPVIGAYLSSRDIVRKSFDYLASTYSYDDVLIISANGCNISNDGEKYGDVFVRNGKNNTIVKIKNSYNEVISEVNKFANQGKMVILLNVDRFVESWTIKEMNVQLILRNVGSPDTFGQAIARGTRTYVEQIGDITNVIKKDAYVFLYGDTFTKMVYELFFDKYNYRKHFNRHKDMNSAWDEAMNDLFGYGNTIYMDGKIYGYEENNLTDLRDVILRDSIRCNRSADSLISTMKRTFSDCFSKLYGMNIPIWKMVKPTAVSKKVNTVDGEGNHNNGYGNGQGSGNSSTGNLKNMTEEELFAKIKTFMYTLLAVRIAKYGFVTLDSGAFDYDTLVLEADEDPIEGKNNYYLEFDKQFTELFGSEITHFKMGIIDWVEGQYLSCMN